MLNDVAAGSVGISDSMGELNLLTQGTLPKSRHTAGAAAHSNNDIGDGGAVNGNRSSVDSPYPLRNRGQNVDNDPWVMNRPLEYKR